MRYKKTNRKNRDFSAIFPLKISKQIINRRKVQKQINRNKDTETYTGRRKRDRGKGTETEKKQVKRTERMS